VRVSNIAEMCLFAALLFFLQTTVGAQKKRNGDKVVDTYPLIWIDAQIVSSATGFAVQGLSHSAFAIFENGRRQTIQAWERGPKELSLLVLLYPPTSPEERKATQGRIEELRSALVHDLKARDQVSILVMADHPILLQGFTSNKQLIVAALEKASKFKGTNTSRVQDRLAEGLQDASRRFEGQAAEGRQAILLISAVSTETAEAVILPRSVVRAVVESRSLLCWDVAEYHFSPLEVYSLDSLSLPALLQFTGGEAVGSDWRSFLDRLRERYRIAFIPFGRAGEWVRIEVKTTLPPERRDVVLTYNRSAIIEPPSR
jgi:hypothetical protein